ncbi:nuclear factor NF-kappa-B p100 subunit isoform X2 [Nematostella vectensis]|uniref:nuclear factor NF-kappa-B p100 subunit isoform X2 n=1 Tax=Nematostella vectensis TaxID=45351 RepID=UPI00138FDF7F|nr:nuclear factor NF-kappa-B p100 subunit isoform X2 [Nematostella vectensis]
MVRPKRLSKRKPTRYGYSTPLAKSNITRAETSDGASKSTSEERKLTKVGNALKGKPRKRKISSEEGSPGPPLSGRGEEREFKTTGPPVTTDCQTIDLNKPNKNLSESREDVIVDLKKEIKESTKVEASQSASFVESERLGPRPSVIAVGRISGALDKKRKKTHKVQKHTSSESSKQSEPVTFVINLDKSTRKTSRSLKKSTKELTIPVASKTYPKASKTDKIKKSHETEKCEILELSNLTGGANQNVSESPGVEEPSDVTWSYEKSVSDLCQAIPKHDPRLFSQDEDGDTEMHHVTLNIYNKLRQTPLHLAAITKQASLVQALLEAGADPNLTDRNCQTALHLACQENDVETLRAIGHAFSSCSQEPDVRAMNSQGMTPLHLATLKGNRELITELLRMGADLNVEDGNSGRSPLHHAVESGRYHVIEFLLSRGALVNQRTFSGNTAMHTAAGRQMDEVVSLLASYGADVNIQNREGDIPRVAYAGSDRERKQIAFSRSLPKQPKRQKVPDT